MALEPLVYFESTATNDTFTKLSAVDSFNLNTDGTELEFPSRNASIPILYAGSGNGAGSIEEARTDIPSLREPCDIYVGQVSDDVQPGGYFFPHQDNSLNPYTPGARQDMEIEVKGADAGTAEEYVVVLMAVTAGPGLSRTGHNVGSSSPGRVSRPRPESSTGSVSRWTRPFRTETMRS
jgi:hypothetical protein